MKEVRQKIETLLLHAGYVPDNQTLSRQVPLYRTTSYVFKDVEHAERLFDLKEEGYIYTRLENPTQDVLEKRMALLEGGESALALSSGTAAIFYSIINIAERGDNIVASSFLYGGTFTMFSSILPQFGIEVRFVDLNDVEKAQALIDSKTKAIYTETIGNPSLVVADLEKIAKFAHKNNVPLIVDSTFTTPYLLKPIEYGADIVIHSLTKWISGHGYAIGGIVIDSGNFDWEKGNFPLMNNPDESYHGIIYSKEFKKSAFVSRMRLVPLRNLGACISPDNAWLALIGLETLHLRMERHCENALKVAEFLSSHKKVSWVEYPGLKNSQSYELARKYLKKGFGGMVVFGIKGGIESGKVFINSLKLFSHLANVGDARSLAIHPASTTHAQLSDEEKKACGIGPDLIRLSVGIENIDDIIFDLNQALEKS